MQGMHIKKSPMGLAHRPNRHTPLHEQHKKQQQKHIEQEKNIYISIQSIDIQRNKKERNVRHEWCQLTVQGLYVNIYLYK